MKWFYHQDDQEVGPVSEATLRELLAAGTINPNTWIRQEGSEEKVTLDLALAEELGSPPPPEAEQSAMEEIKFSCPGCGQHISAGPEAAGVRTACPNCGGEIVVPGTSEPGDAPAADSPPEPPTPTATPPIGGSTPPVDNPERDVIEPPPQTSTVPEVQSDAAPDSDDKRTAPTAPLKEDAEQGISGKEVAHQAARYAKQKVGRLKEKLGSADEPNTIVGKWKAISAILFPPTSTSEGGQAPRSAPYSLKRAIPLFICCLAFGWVLKWLAPLRVYPDEMGLGSLCAVALLAIPAVMIAVLGFRHLLDYPRLDWPKLIGALLFTMTIGIFILLTYHKLAAASQVFDNRYYGRATPIVLGTKLIGWSRQFIHEGNLFQKLFASTIHTGFCEEVTKLLPLFLVAFLNRKKPELPRVRMFLLIGFFSGLGFGIGEALYYYAPWSGDRFKAMVETNVTRWYACVPLHAIYTVVDAALLWLMLPTFKKTRTGLAAFGVLLAAALAIALLHGTYNTFYHFHTVLAITLDASAILLMVWLVKKCLAREKPAGLSGDEEPSRPNLPLWLRSKDGFGPSFGKLFGGGLALLVASLAFTESVTPSSYRVYYNDDSGYQNSPYGSQTWNSSGSGSYGAAVLAANRRAVRQFEEMLELSSGLVMGNDAQAAVVKIVAAIDNTNWNGCSQDLRSAASALRNVQDGDRMSEISVKIQRFSDLCDRYR